MTATTRIISRSVWLNNFVFFEKLLSSVQQVECMTACNFAAITPIRKNPLDTTHEFTWGTNCRHFHIKNVFGTSPRMLARGLNRAGLMIRDRYTCL
jgi:hypothetical protein